MPETPQDPEDTPIVEPVVETSFEPDAPPAPLLELRDGLPEITDTDEGLAEACAALAAATGPVAIDAERASGYRYSNRAYLIQLRREGSGTWLIDPMLGEVGWSWLTEALQAHGASYAAISGTVTRVSTESFGGMADEAGSAQVEIRASWTPDVDEDGGLDMTAHVEAWGELMCTAVGLPPVPEGVTAIPSRRGQRGT